MADAREKVLEETKLFFASYENLQEKFGGRWVVFRGGKVRSDHATEGEAFEAAVEKYGVGGGFMVECVVPKKPIPITAGVLFGV